MLPLLEKQTGEAWEPSKSNAISDIGDNRNVLSLLLRGQRAKDSSFTILKIVYINYHQYL
jgi:hypothetical protein